MKVLVDTHALLWATISPASLSRKASAMIANEANTILISAASAWEIATKVRLGKLPGAEGLERRFLEVMEIAGYTILSIAAADALRAGRLMGRHHDPFDRIIAAQALADDIPVISAAAVSIPQLAGCQRALAEHHSPGRRETVTIPPWRNESNRIGESEWRE